jgi:predicted nucleic acid-binding protein
MILVDTSVLIGYFQGRRGYPFDLLDEFVDNNIPFGLNNYIYQEVLQGVKTEKEFQRLKEYLDTLLFYELLQGRRSYAAAAHLYFKCRQAGYTVRSTLDFLIVQTALENNLYLLHNDKDFTNIAKVIKGLKIYK